MPAIVFTLSKAKLLASVLWNPQLTEETHGQLSSNIFLRFKKRDGHYVMSATSNQNTDFSGLKNSSQY